MRFLFKKAISHQYQNSTLKSKTGHNNPGKFSNTDLSINSNAEIMDLTGSEIKYVMGLSKLTLQ